MCEWLKQAVLKTAVRETVPGVRIPLPPPRSLSCRESLPPFPRNTRKMPICRDYSGQIGLQRTDCSIGVLETEFRVSISPFVSSFRIASDSGINRRTSVLPAS